MNERIYYSQEAKDQAMRERGILALFALSVGVGIGSALALLLAPKSGEAMRDNLAGLLENRMETVERQVESLRDRIEDRISDLT